MSFLPTYVGSLMTLLCVASASDIQVSVGGKESNVTSVSSVFLPPPLSEQHSKDTSNYQSDSPTFVLSDAPTSIEFHQMDRPSKLLASIQQDYEKMKKEVEDRSATYEKARKEFDSKKDADQKELEKLGDIIKERQELEQKLIKERKELNDLKKKLDDEEESLKVEEKIVEDMQSRKEEVERKHAELLTLSMKLEELKKAVTENLGECIEVPPKLKAIWGESVHPDTRLCMKADASKQ